MNLEKTLAFLIKCRDDEPTQDEIDEALAIRSTAQRVAILYKEFVRAGFEPAQAYQLAAVDLGRTEVSLWFRENE